MTSIEEIRRIRGDVLGIDSYKIGLDENSIDCMGFTVKDLQLLGEIASHNVGVNLETFINTGTIQNLWNALHTQTGNVHSTNGHVYNGNKEWNV
ncbi:hypothetical protein GGP41_008915 [Bipolaris sorokiniana]|uniref:Carrier domain-containing protein n=1 Tax=Cochliobolus sativus TaxID=45130 RepID=A0A8H6DQL2_COCSA|nr:hypothetical protein GGP41_008915 [Bipolaris sorokiniana]